MRLRVIHKGLIIVGVPLVLEAVIIGVLGYLLYRSDVTYSLESSRSGRTTLGAKLVFADCKAGCTLIHAWRTQELALLGNFDLQRERLDGLTRDLRNIPEDIIPEISLTHRACLDVQDRLSGYLKEIGELTAGGIDIGSMTRVIKLQHDMMKDLDKCFTDVRKLYDLSDETLRETQLLLQTLQETEFWVVGAGFVLNLVAASALFWYFQRSFTKPLAAISQNVERLAQRQPLAPPLQGVDEIAELDLAFHGMNAQLDSAAERERTLFDNSSDVIGVIDSSFHLVRINQAVSKLWGRDPAELVGQSLAQLFGSSSEKVEQALTRGRSQLESVSFELELSRVDGEPVQTLWSAFWSEQQLSWYCIVADVSVDRKLAQMRQAFLKLIAADFQRPMHHMSGLLTNLSSDRELPTGIGEKLSKANATLKRLVVLVDDLLDLESLQGPATALSCSECLVLDLLEQARGDTESLARERQVSVVIDCDATLSWFADAHKVVRVLINFLSNAIKFSPSGATVRLEACRLDDQSVLVKVIDNGRGIPANAMTNLFQAFKQTDAADGKRGKGTGLGLVICKKIVEQHGGAVGVESEDGKGSTFWFNLPLRGRSGAVNSNAPESNAVALGPVLSAAPVQVPSSPMLKVEKQKGISLMQRSAILIGVPVLFEVVFVAFLIANLIANSEELNKLMASRLVVSSAVRMTMAFYDVTLSARRANSKGFDIDRLGALVNDLDQRIGLFKRDVLLDPLGKKYGPAVLAGANHLAPNMREYHKILVNDKRVTDLQLSNASDFLLLQTDKLGDLALELVEACEKRESTSPERQAFLRTWQAIMLVAGLVSSAVIAGGLAFIFARDVAGRLKVLSDNSRRLAAGEPLNPPLPGSDEISALDLAFHRTANLLIGERAKERAFLDFSPSIICSLDGDGRFTAVNPASTRILSRGPETMIYRQLAELVDPDDSAIVTQALSDARRGGEPARAVVRMTGAQDRPVDLQWSITYSDRESEYFAVAHDVSARRELERMKKEFLALVTHDLRTPLTTILGLMGLALAGALGKLSENARAIVLEVKSEAEQILELVNDLLDMEKLEAGQLKLDLANVDLDQVIRSALNLAGHRLSEGDLQIETVGAQTGINADLDRLSHALASLLIEGRTVSSSLKLLLTTSSNGAVLDLVCQGSNEHPELVRNVIERMEGKQTESKTRGSRMRLPLARSIFKSHNASIKASANVHGDLNFSIALPLSVK